MRELTIAALLAGTLLAGCSPATPPTTEAAKAEKANPTAPANTPAGTSANATASSNAEACPSDGPHLPLSGICQARGEKSIQFAGGPRPGANEGCGWVVSETQMIDQVLLYMGQKCKDKATKLEFSAGAKSAEISLTASPMAGVMPDGEGPVIVRVFTVEGADPKASVLAHAREAIEDKAESARCVVKSAMQEGWPADALVVEDPKVIQPKNELGDGSCGPYGNDPSASSFWRVVGEHVYFVDLGQDVWEVDPGSFTVVPLATATSEGAAGDSKAN